MVQMIKQTTAINNLRLSYLYQLSSIVILWLLMVPSLSTKQSALFELGYEEWEQPAEQQLAAQFKLLTDQYKQKGHNNPTLQQKYRKIVTAYEQLKAINAQTSSDQHFHRSRPQSRNKHNAYRGQYETWAQSDIQNRNQNRRRTKEGFYYESSQFFPNAEQIKLKINQQLKRMNLDFLAMGEGKEGQDVDHIKLKLNFPQFVKWLLVNPQIVIAALLISFGIINLCTCCCCCFCCRPCKKTPKKEQKEKDKHSGEDRSWDNDWRGVNNEYRRMGSTHLHQD